MNFSNIEKTSNGITIIFFKENSEDTKYSWKIKRDPELTKLLLQNSKSKKVKEKAIYFAAKGIFEKIKNRSNLKKIEDQVKDENPIVELGMLCQKMFQESIYTENLGQQGPRHEPEVHVRITLPNGEEFEASASNKKIAKRIAAEEALKSLRGEDAVKDKRFQIEEFSLLDSRKTTRYETLRTTKNKLGEKIASILTEMMRVGYIGRFKIPYMTGNLDDINKKLNLVGFHVCHGWPKKQNKDGVYILN